jgi:hypothetical protein
MKLQDEFAGWMAGAALRSADEEIQAIFLDDVLDQVREGEELDTALTRTLKSERRSGDFGMDIVGPLIVPVLIEAGRQLWRIYAKKLTEKAADKLSDATITGVKKIVKNLWSGNEGQEVRNDFEKLIRVAGEKQGIQSDVIEKLISGIQAERFPDELPT